MMKGLKLTEASKRRISVGMKKYFKEHPISKERARRMTRHCHGKTHPSWKGGKKPLPCRNCGKDCKLYPWRVLRLNGKNPSCSRSCHSSWLANHQSANTRKKLSILASRRNHDPEDRFGKRGNFTRKYGIFFHSYYEVRFYEIMKRLGVRCERNSDRFRYVWRGGVHYYTPDFKIFTPLVVYIEIKGWPRPRDIEKLKAVRKAGKEIWMFTDLGLSSLEKEGQS